MKCIGQAGSGSCLSCLEAVEAAPHTLACEQRVQGQASFLDLLHKPLAKLHTQPSLQTILMMGIQGALQNNPLFDMPTNNG
jgi:hypothetical protein